MVISLAKPNIFFADTGDLQIEDQFVVKPGNGAVRLNGIPHLITGLSRRAPSAERERVAMGVQACRTR